MTAPKVKARGMPFADEMVRAIQAERKRQTRRPIKGDHGSPTAWVERDGLWHPCADELCRGTLDAVGPGVRCPFGKVGDLIYVRETWATIVPSTMNPHRERLSASDRVLYRADKEHATNQRLAGYWRPSIHMPRWTARIVLEITRVRVQRLQEISEEDARAEGITCVPFRPDDGFPVCDGYMAGEDDGKAPLLPSAREAFAALWSSIYGAESWRRNDWTWTLDFQRVDVAALREAA